MADAIKEKIFMNEKEVICYRHIMTWRWINLFIFFVIFFLLIIVLMLGGVVCRLENRESVWINILLVVFFLAMWYCLKKFEKKLTQVFQKKYKNELIVSGRGESLCLSFGEKRFSMHINQLKLIQTKRCVIKKSQYGGIERIEYQMIIKTNIGTFFFLSENYDVFEQFKKAERKINSLVRNCRKKYYISLINK